MHGWVGRRKAGCGWIRPPVARRHSIPQSERTCAGAQTVCPISVLPRRAAFVGNSLPRRCGIATFTTDLQQAIATYGAIFDTTIVAMTAAGRHQPVATTRSIRFWRRSLRRTTEPSAITTS